MNEVDVQIIGEHMNDLRREADNERLAHRAENYQHNNMLTNVRKFLGRGLIIFGQQLLR